MREIVDAHGKALKFDSEQSFKKALEIVFDREISHVLVGDLTVIVPPSRIGHFQHLPYTPVPVLSAAKLPGAEINRLRRKYLALDKR